MLSYGQTSLNTPMKETPMNLTSTLSQLPPSTWIGYVAAVMTTLAFVPQAYMTWKTRSVESISLGMYTIFTVGVAMWLVYGMLTRDWPIIGANLITLMLAGFILGLKLYYSINFRKYLDYTGLL